MKIRILNRLSIKLSKFIKSFKKDNKMEEDQLLENLTEEQKKLGSRFSDLVIGRVIKRVHSGLDEAGKQNMEKVFLSDDQSEKENFIKKNIPNFETIFKEEADKVEEEIKAEIEKQI